MLETFDMRSSANGSVASLATTEGHKFPPNSIPSFEAAVTRRIPDGPVLT